jgi:hypothetical protein
MPTQSRTGKRTTPVVLSRELTDAQQAIADQPIPSQLHESTQLESGPSPDHETITKRAYELYQQEGSIDGRALDHWLEAERQVLSPRYVRN